MYNNNQEEGNDANRNHKEKAMKRMIENQNDYDVIVDDGGRLYYLQFTAGPMSEDEIVADFMDGYDGDISEDEIEVVFPE